MANNYKKFYKKSSSKRVVPQNGGVIDDRERREVPDVDDEKEAPVAYEYNDNYFDEEQEAPVARRLDFDDEATQTDAQKTALRNEFIKHIHQGVNENLDESEIYNESTELSNNIDIVLRYYIGGFEGRLTENTISYYETTGYPAIAAILRMTDLSEGAKLALFREVGEDAKEFYLANATEIMSGDMELPANELANEVAEEFPETQENDWAPIAPQPLPLAPEINAANHGFHVIPIAIEGRPVLAQIDIAETIYDTVGMEDVVISDKLAGNTNNIVIEYNGAKFFVDIADLANMMDDAKYYACYEDSRYLGRTVDGVSVTNINRNVVLYDIKKVGVGADVMLDMASITNLLDHHNVAQRAYSIVKTTLTVPSTVSFDIADRQGNWVSGHHCSTGATQVFTIVPAVLVNGALAQVQAGGQQVKKSQKGGNTFTDAQIEHIARHIARIIKDEHTEAGLNGLRAMTDDRIRRRLARDWVEDAFVNDGTDDTGVPLELFQGLDEDGQIPIIERALPIAFTKMIEYLRGNTDELDNLPNVVNFDSSSEVDSDFDDNEEINTQPMRFTNPAQIDDAMEQLLARHQQLQQQAQNANAQPQPVNADPFEDAINAQQYDRIDANEEEGITLIENNRTVYDPIELEDIAISAYLDSDPNNIVLEFNGTVYPVNKDHIRQQAGDAKYYGCYENNGLMAREVNGARQTNIDRSTILYDIKKASGIMIDGFLEFAAINRLLDPESEIRAFSIVKTTKTIPSAVSFDIAARQGSWMSGHHCTTGAANVYTLVTAEIAEVQNGGKHRKTTSKKEHINKKQKQLLAKYYNIYV